MIIMMAIKDEIVPFITNVEEPSVFWRTLQDLFKNQNVVMTKNGLIRTLYLTNKLHSMKMEKGSLITDFIRSIKELTV